MKLGDVARYVKSMSISIVFMLLLTYGMATDNPWLQPIWIILIMLPLTFGYQMIKAARSSKIVEANTREASRVRRGMILFEASGGDVNKAKGKVKGDGEMSMGTKMVIMLLAPLTIFYVSGYLMSILVPGIEHWQSYMIAFLLTMPVSTILTSRMGVSPGMMVVTPNAYVVSERGIAFDHMGQPFILRFPLTKLNVQKEKNFIEAEGKAETSIIPNRLRLFTEKIDQLNKILAKHVINQDTHRK